MLSLTNAQIRALKAQAQRLKPTLKVGKVGLSPQFLAALDETLKHHELIKVKFDEFKEQKKELHLCYKFLSLIRCFLVLELHHLHHPNQQQ